MTDGRGNLPSFAIVPWSVLRCGTRLRDGPVMLLSFIYALQHFHSPAEGDPEDLQFRKPADGWEAAIGHDRRIVKRWFAELQDREWIFEEGFDGRRMYQIAYNDSTEHRCKLSLDFIGKLAPDMWRTWAVLRSYTGPKGYAYPRRETLAEDLGLSRPETVSDRLRRLERLMLVERTRRRIGSNIYHAVADVAERDKALASMLLACC